MPSRNLPLLAMLAAGLTAGTSAATPCLAETASAPIQTAPPAAAIGPCDLEPALRRSAPTLRPEALHAALAAWNDLTARGETMRPLLTVIDYSLPSTSKRLWVMDLASRRLLFNDLVAHGRNSGEDLARSFSNEQGSLMSSLGAFVTGDTYRGKNGY